jgi:hypothetical protein
MMYVLCIYSYTQWKVAWARCLSLPLVVHSQSDDEFDDDDELNHPDFC